MSQDTTIEIRRVSNGYIVTPSWNPALRSETVAILDNTFVFETFEAMVSWLDLHFTKPGEAEIKE